MVRRNRLITRISLILVIGMGLFGGWFARHNWQPDFAAYDTAIISQDTDWIDVIAGLGEEAVQLLLGLTSDGQ